MLRLLLDEVWSLFLCDATKLLVASLQWLWLCNHTYIFPTRNLELLVTKSEGYLIMLTLGLKKKSMFVVHRAIWSHLRTNARWICSCIRILRIWLQPVKEKMFTYSENGLYFFYLQYTDILILWLWSYFSILIYGNFRSWIWLMTCMFYLIFIMYTRFGLLMGCEIRVLLKSIIL